MNLTDGTSEERKAMPSAAWLLQGDGNHLELVNVREIIIVKMNLKQVKWKGLHWIYLAHNRDN